MKNVIATMVLAFVFSSVSAQTDTIAKKKFHWGRNSQDTSAGYAQAVLSNGVLYISGTVGAGDMASAVKQVYAGLERTLKHYGLSFQNVVKENLYTTDIEAVKANNAVRKEYYKGDFPAATWVQISRLYMPNATLEVALIAHLPKK
jgi:2-iminobutanoate/2-iminopropanoate deaminase